MVTAGSELLADAQNAGEVITNELVAPFAVALGLIATSGNRDRSSASFSGTRDG